MRFYRLLHVLLATWPMVLPAQINVTVSFSTDTIEIGKEVRLTVSILKERDVIVTGIPESLTDSIYSAYQMINAQQSDTSQTLRPVRADYQVLSYGKWDYKGDGGLFGFDDLDWSVSEAGSEQLLENSISLKMWDPGDNFLIIPPVFYEKEGIPGRYDKAEAVSLFVSPPGGIGPNSSDSLSLAPIKPIITEEADLTDFVGVIYGLAALLVLILAYVIFKYLTKTRDIEEIVEKIPNIPAHEKALEALDELRGAKLWQSGQIKAYQSQLTYIIRQYIEGRYHIKALEETTRVIVEDVKKCGVDSALTQSLDRILHVADLVKFAKARPEVNIHEEFMEEAVRFVKLTSEKKQMTSDQYDVNSAHFQDEID